MSVPKNPGFSLSLLVFLLLILVSPLPAHAYGDPSGGMLFQILTPILAALWGAWLVFAHKIHAWFGRVTGKELVATAESHDVEHADGLTQQVERAGVQE